MEIKPYTQDNDEVITFSFTTKDKKWEVLSTANVPWEREWWETLRARGIKGLIKDKSGRTIEVHPPEILAFDPEEGITINRTNNLRTALADHFAFTLERMVGGKWFCGVGYENQDGIFCIRKDIDDIVSFRKAIDKITIPIKKGRLKDLVKP